MKEFVVIVVLLVLSLGCFKKQNPTGTEEELIIQTFVDLKVVGVTGSPNPTCYNKWVDVSVQVSNLGVDPAGASLMQFVLNGEARDGVNTPPIDARDTVTVTHRILLAQETEANLIVILDAHDAVTEVFEDNNRQEFPNFINIDKPPGLISVTYQSTKNSITFFFSSNDPVRLYHISIDGKEPFDTSDNFYKISELVSGQTVVIEVSGYMCHLGPSTTITAITD
jgi:hypothetical protein